MIGSVHTLWCVPSVQRLVNDAQSYACCYCIYFFSAFASSAAAAEEEAPPPSRRRCVRPLERWRELRCSELPPLRDDLEECRSDDDPGCKGHTHAHTQHTRTHTTCRHDVSTQSPTTQCNAANNAPCGGACSRGSGKNPAAVRSLRARLPWTTTIEHHATKTWQKSRRSSCAPLPWPCVRVKPL